MIKAMQETFTAVGGHFDAEALKASWANAMWAKRAPSEASNVKEDTMQISTVMASTKGMIPSRPPYTSYDIRSPTPIVSPNLDLGDRVALSEGW